MLIDAVGLVSIRPVNYDIVRVAFLQPVSLLMGENIEIELIKSAKMRVGNTLGFFVSGKFLIQVSDR
jgi:hypothetical protein